MCTKTLYNYIDKRLLKVRNIDLLLKVQRKVSTTKSKQNNRIFGTSIEERPDEINNRTSFGYWGIDTIVGKKESSSVLLSIDERLTRKRHIVKIPSRSSEAVRIGLQKFTTLIHTPLMKEALMKKITHLFSVSSLRANLLMILLINRSLLLNIGSIICLVKCSIITLLILFFKCSI
ncbi:MAG: IS30 family transposase [Acutalibacteraceae bacterium]